MTTRPAPSPPVLQRAWRAGAAMTAGAVALTAGLIGYVAHTATAASSGPGTTSGVTPATSGQQGDDDGGFFDDSGGSRGGGVQLPAQNQPPVGGSHGS